MHTTSSVTSWWGGHILKPARSGPTFQSSAVCQPGRTHVVLKRSLEVTKRVHSLTSGWTEKWVMHATSSVTSWWGGHILKPARSRPTFQSSAVSQPGRTHDVCPPSHPWFWIFGVLSAQCFPFQKNAGSCLSPLYYKCRNFSLSRTAQAAVLTHRTLAQMCVAMETRGIPIMLYGVVNNIVYFVL